MSAEALNGVASVGARRSWVRSARLRIAYALLAGALCACSAGGSGSADGAGCHPGDTSVCSCPSGQTTMVACRPDGTGFAPCPVCGTPQAGTSASDSAAMGGGTGGAGMLSSMPTPTGGTGGSSQPPPPPPPPPAGGTGGTAITGGAGGMTAGAGGMSASGTSGGGSGGMSGTGSAGSGGSAAGSGGSSASDDQLEEARQICVDTINMYRATLSLAPIDRATPEQEACSDQGAMQDADNNAPHSSSGSGNPCSTGPFSSFPGFGSQNTCPGWPVGGGFGGYATLADAIKGCLKSMWDEGEPPEGEAQCEAEYRMGDTACFLKYGHYLNMKRDGRGVSCGFYDMQNGKWWMNQDFY